MAKLRLDSSNHLLGIGLLGSEAIDTIWPLSPPAYRQVSIAYGALGNEPALLIDWGRALAVQDIDKLRVLKLDGSLIGEVEPNVSVTGAILQPGTGRLLFWGGKQGVIGVYLGDLRTHRVRTIQEWASNPNGPDGSFSASFTGLDGSRIRICRGFENYVLAPDGSLVERLPLDLEEAAESPNGRFVAGRQRGGTLLLVDRSTEKTWDTGIATLGLAKWDPRSQYVLCVSLTHAPFWMVQSSIVIVDVLDHTSMRTVAIAPDERYHPYEWMILPPE